MHPYKLFITFASGELNLVKLGFLCVILSLTISVGVHRVNSTGRSAKKCLRWKLVS